MSAKTRAAEIRAEGITKKFGNFVALDDVSLTVGRGEFLTLLGPSGSGKTTFLMTLAGFEAPTHGTLSLDGRDVTHVLPEERAFGMVFQGYALFPHMSVEQNIAFPLKVQRRRGAELKRRVSEMIEMVGLDGHGHKKPAALSGGQQQRVALARALACEPSVLLLDEPFSALDKNLRGQMQDEMRRLHRETGTTFIFVTHDQSEALALSSRIAIFEQGKLQQVDTPRKVYEQPENRFVAEFLGEINLLPLTSVNSNSGVTTGLFEQQPLSAPSALDNSRVPSDVLAVRPEHMRLAASKQESKNNLRAQVVDITYLGAQSRLELRSASGGLLTLSHATAMLPSSVAPGVQVWVNWPQEQGFFLNRQNGGRYDAETIV